MKWLCKKKRLDKGFRTNVTPLVVGAVNALPAPSPFAEPPVRTVRSAVATIIPLSAIAVAVAAVAGASADWDSWMAGRSIQSTDDAALFADVSLISARVSGTIDQTAVDDYVRVKAGDLLFSIDQKPYEVALESAEAKLEAARAQVEDNESQSAYQMTQIDVAVAQEEASAADEIQTDKELERQKRLALDGGASSVQNMEKATAAHDRALANLKMAGASITAQRLKVEVLAKQRNALKANVDTAGADVHARKLDLTYTTVRAPVDGVVGKRDAQVGNYVSVGTGLISIVPLPHLYVLANYKENQMGRVREGQPVQIVVDMLPGEVLNGVVTKISPASGATFALLPPDNATGNFTKVAQRLTVRIEMDPAQPQFDLLRPGMSVVTKIATAKAERRD